MIRASSLSTDALVVDWEDAVLAADKHVARRITLDFLRQQSLAPFGFIRYNPAGTSEFEEDIKTLKEFIPDGIVLSKCRNASDVAGLEDALAAADPNRRCAICPLIESSVGLLNAFAIAGASPRICGVAFGAEDFCAEMSIRRTEEEVELLYARSAIVTACRAAGAEPIDSPCLEFRDLRQLEASAARARNVGFSGKLAIHPDQIDCLNRVFAPDAHELARARQILEAFSSAGTGVITVDGKMVDEAVLKNARRLLAEPDVD